VNFLFFAPFCLISNFLCFNLYYFSHSYAELVQRERGRGGERMVFIGDRFRCDSKSEKEIEKEVRLVLKSFADRRF